MKVSQVMARLVDHGAGGHQPEKARFCMSTGLKSYRW